MKDTLRYRNLGGGTVTWIYTELNEDGHRQGSWDCDGCGVDGEGQDYLAVRHAGACRAY